MFFQWFEERESEGLGLPGFCYIKRDVCEYTDKDHCNVLHRLSQL